MKRLVCRQLLWLGSVGLVTAALADEARFYRAINLNGPRLTIDGRKWEGKDATNFTFKGNTFENQSVPLKPPTDPARAQMIRSSVWGGNADLELTSLPDCAYQVFLYVWEDNHTERIDFLVNDRPVLEGFYSGNAGNWKRLGPWKSESIKGRLKVSARGGAANLSGLEVWAGDGAIPAGGEASFVTQLTPEHTQFFEKRIRPLLIENCYECHSAGAKKLRGGLLLDSRGGVVKGGDTGPVVVPGSPEASLLIQAVKHIDPNLTMPPKKKLSAEQIADLVEWIRMGAPDPRTENTVASVSAKSAIDWNKAREFWSFRPLAKPSLPAVKQKDWPANEIDHFLLARMEQAKLKPSEDAEKRVLVRRATFDLIGLPPTPEEIDAFLSDTAPKAFARVVDRLLGSPHYGERWGRHWLDVVRYADTAGDNSDFPIPQMYRYRNWVIAALNRDVPYDQFVRLQLAGDLLPNSEYASEHERLIATGYIANARRFGSRVSDYPQHLTIEDTIDNLGRAFLGLTVNCARCHDHKFDPIPTRDYYALYGIFHSTRYPWPGIELEQTQRDLVPLVPAEQIESAKKAHKEKQKELDAEVARLQKEIKSAEGEEKKKLEKTLDQSKKAAEKHKRSPLPIEQAYAVAEAGKIEDCAIQQKGDPAKVGAVVRRGFLQVLNGAELPSEAKTSGRLQLADWIVSKDNPITARVMVNRIWHYHFGRGIVPTPNDFGRQGKPPTHPALLDWLASRFIESGWSIKSMHRLIMLSGAYQLESRLGAEAQARDPANELLSAFPRRRLDAESIRDTLLALGGNLDRSPGGAHPFPPQPDWNFTQHNPFKATYDTSRRSVYLMTQRIQRHPYLGIFDGPDPAASTATRQTSTTPLQALYLLNDPFVHEQSQRFASRLVAEASDDAARLERAYQLALGRSPDPAEIDRGREFLASVRSSCSGAPAERVEADAWQAMARVILRLNEFVYID
jgi:hypothetical protein